MKYLSGVMRALSGVLIIIMAVHVYLISKDFTGDHETVVLFGQPLNVSPHMLQVFILGGGVIGFLLTVYGIMTFFRRPRSA